MSPLPTRAVAPLARARYPVIVVVSLIVASILPIVPGEGVWRTEAPSPYREENSTCQQHKANTLHTRATIRQQRIMPPRHIITYRQPIITSRVSTTRQRSTQQRPRSTVKKGMGTRRPPTSTRSAKSATNTSRRGRTGALRFSLTCA